MTFSRIKKTQDPEFKKLGIKVYDKTPVVVKHYEDVSADMLQDIFTAETGLYTRM